MSAVLVVMELFLDMVAAGGAAAMIANITECAASNCAWRFGSREDDR